MCGRFSLTSDPARLAVELDAVDEASAPPAGLFPAEAPRSPRYNVAPTTTISALVWDAPREGVQESGGPDEPGAAPVRVLRAMRWGLVPSWAKDDGKLPNLFNARVETAHEKPSFRSAVKRRHCAVPMDGWYEWLPGEKGAGGKAGPKQPVHMSLPGDAGLLMAGLWEARRDPADESVTQLSCTILTTAAVGPLREVHDRMPLVVPDELLAEWLDAGELTDPRELVDEARLEEWAETVEIRRVSRAVSNVRNDGPELVRPLAAPDDGAGTEGLF